MTAAVGTAAACSKVRLAGLRTTVPATHTYSAKAPLLVPPNTVSPGRRSVTVAPTASTVPAKSAPGTGCLGRRSPAAGRAMYGRPVTAYHSAGFTDDERTRTSTSSSVRSGWAMSWSWSTSGDPNRWWTIAFTVPSSPRPAEAYAGPAEREVGGGGGPHGMRIGR